MGRLHVLSPYNLGNKTIRLYGKNDKKGLLEVIETVGKIKIMQVRVESTENIITYLPTASKTTGIDRSKGKRWCCLLPGATVLERKPHPDNGGANPPTKSSQK